MKRLPLPLLLLLPVVTWAAGPEAPSRSVSTSGQFVVYAENATTRSKAVMKAEEFKKAFLDYLQIEADEWKIPIVLNLGATPPNARRPPQFLLGIYEGDAGSAKIQLDVFDLDLIKTIDYETQLLRAIALEYTYRNTAIKTGRAMEMPAPWFVDGLLERIRSRESGLKASIYSSLLAGGKVPKLDDFCDTDPDRMDPTSRAMYRAQSHALIEAITDLPDGRKGLRAFLSEPRKLRGASDTLIEVLPSLGGNSEGLNRKWVLAIASASASNRVDPLSVGETGSQLAELLDIKPLPDPKHPEVAAMSGPYALETIAKSDSGRFILTQLSDGLLRLSVRAHPLFKPLVDEYLGIVRELIAKPKRRVGKRVAAAEEMRAALTQQTSEMRDYMDWVNATQVKAENEEVAAAIDEIEEIEQPPPRNDALSRYIDALNERGW